MEGINKMSNVKAPAFAEAASRRQAKFEHLFLLQTQKQF
jgi:hypothetical protein